jgi:glycosyltransferase involved in cell wall biosynthesis
VDVVDREFYEQEIAPQIDGQQIEYLGEISHQEKAQLLANASATLFTITWPEPFGLVMVESMATGTPVIAMKYGSVPEVVAHGQTGFVCSTLEEAIAALPQAIALDRHHCRQYVEQFFSISSMVDGYEAAYRKILKKKLLKVKAA